MQKLVDNYQKNTIKIYIPAPLRLMNNFR